MSSLDPESHLEGVFLGTSGPVPRRNQKPPQGLRQGDFDGETTTEGGQPSLRDWQQGHREHPRLRYGVGCGEVSRMAGAVVLGGHRPAESSSSKQLGRTGQMGLQRWGPSTAMRLRHLSLLCWAPGSCGGSWSWRDGPWALGSQEAVFTRVNEVHSYRALCNVGSLLQLYGLPGHQASSGGVEILTWPKVQVPSGC